MAKLEQSNIVFTTITASTQQKSPQTPHPLASVKVTEKWVLLMGHEGDGLSEEILALCDEVVTIEMMEGVKSFNVGIAASIMMYQFKHKG